MKEFIMIFRNDSFPEEKLTPEGMVAVSQQWENWISSIAAQNKLVARGARLGSEGCTIQPNNVITNGPYAEIKEIIGGYSIIRADSVEEAAEIAKSCPGLAMGGSVEVRYIAQMYS